MLSMLEIRYPRDTHTEEKKNNPIYSSIIKQNKVLSNKLKDMKNLFTENYKTMLKEIEKAKVNRFLVFMDQKT